MTRFKQVQDAADEREWSHAATLLERLTIDLDALGSEQDEAQALLDFVRQEWSVLRNQCNASSIPVTDEDMRDTEAAILEQKNIKAEERSKQRLSNLVKPMLRWNDCEDVCD